MTSVLVDTNVFIALVDRGDALHARAVSDLSALSRAQLSTTGAVLSECSFALHRLDQRLRLAAFLERLPVAPVEYDDERAVRRDVFKWMSQYAEHTPDYADAELCALSARGNGARIWTYDTEFETIWRTIDGRRLELVGKRKARR